MQPHDLDGKLPAGRVRVTRTDNAVYVMRDARVAGDSLIGQSPEAAVQVAVAVREIRRVEAVNDEGVVSSRLAGGEPIGVILVLLIVLLVFLSSDIRFM